MSYEVRYYRCPKCKRSPHIRFTEDMKGKILEIECEFCLHTFEVNEKDDPQSKPETNLINRE